MKAHCLFEQSGTFKRAFQKLGIQAEDYDILNDFGETDHKCDLFEQINIAYGGGKSVFDNIVPGDIILLEEYIVQREQKRIEYTNKNGLSRSMIAPEYADRFIREYIL